MSKIVITEEETSAANPDVYNGIPPVNNVSKPKSFWQQNGLALCIVGAILAAVCVTVVVLSSPYFQSSAAFNSSSKTVAEFEQEATRVINQGLANPSHEFRKYVEVAHLSVTITSAQVIKCVATTMDGSNLAGKNDENIQFLDCEIEFRWDGVIHKNGTTVLAYRFDGQNGQVLSAQITKTDALINVEDPKFWYKVGWTIGALLL